MVELISNGERLGTVREKLNATLRPYASRAEFEASSIPAPVTLVNVIEGGSIYQLIRDPAGDWQDGGGSKWSAMLLSSLEADWFVDQREQAEAAAAAASASQSAAADAAASAIGAASDAASTLLQAEAAATEAALYDGPKVDTFSGLASVTPAMLAVGGLIRVIETGAAYRRVSSGGDLDYTGSGGVRLVAIPVASELTAAQFGAVGGVGVSAEVAAANTAAINKLFDRCAKGRICAVLDQTYEISDTVTFRTRSGRGSVDGVFNTYPEAGEIRQAKGAELRMQGNNRRILILHGRGIVSNDICVRYVTFQDIPNTNSVGIAYRDLSFARFGEHFARGAYIGVGQDFDWSENNWFFDNVISSLRAYEFSFGGVRIHPKNEGNTQSVINSISALAPNVTGLSPLGILRGSGETTYWQPNIEFGVRIKGTRGLQVGKINIESMACATNMLDFDDSECTVGAVHYEAVGITGAYGALMKAQNAYPSIGQVSTYDVDLGVAAGVTPTALFQTWGSGLWIIGTLKVFGFLLRPASFSMMRSLVGGNKIETFVDGVSGGSGLVSADNSPMCVWTGSAVAHRPVITRFNGADILPSAHCRSYGSGTTSTAGVVSIPVVYDRSGSMSGGVFTAPETGLYQWAARLRAAESSLIDVRVTKNGGSDTLSRWAHDRTTGTSDVQLRYAMQSGIAYLSAGETIEMQLNSGTALLDNTCYFSVCKLSL